MVIWLSFDLLFFLLKKSSKDVEKNVKKCYSINGYTTDGSGIDHMEYNFQESTVWASVWTSRLFFRYLEELHYIFLLEVEILLYLWYKRVMKSLVILSI